MKKILISGVLLLACVMTYAGSNDVITLGNSPMKYAFGCSKQKFLATSDKEHTLTVDYPADQKGGMSVWRNDFKQDVTEVSGPMRVTLEVKGTGTISASYGCYDSAGKHFDSQWLNVTPGKVKVNSPDKWTKVEFKLMPYLCSNFTEKTSFVRSFLSFAPGSRFVIRRWDSVIKEPCTLIAVPNTQNKEKK